MQRSVGVNIKNIIVSIKYYFRLEACYQADCESLDDTGKLHIKTTASY